MLTFMFQVLVAIIVAGLFLYLARYFAAQFGLPQPIMVVLTVVVVLLLCWWLISAFPAAGAHPAGHVLR
jgi:ABC-type nickel/cobalt efflux system permease component RcnA